MTGLADTDLTKIILDTLPEDSVLAAIQCLLVRRNRKGCMVYDRVVGRSENKCVKMYRCVMSLTNKRGIVMK